MTTKQKQAADEMAKAVRQWELYEAADGAEVKTFNIHKIRQRMVDARKDYEAAAKEPEDVTDAWSAKTPWERCADLLGSAEASRICSKRAPKPEAVTLDEVEVWLKQSGFQSDKAALMCISIARTAILAERAKGAK